MHQKIRNKNICIKVFAFRPIYASGTLTSASKHQPNTSEQDNRNCTLTAGEDSTIRYKHKVIELKPNLNRNGIHIYWIRVFAYSFYNSEKKHYNIK